MDGTRARRSGAGCCGAASGRCALTSLTLSTATNRVIKTKMDAANQMGERAEEKEEEKEGEVEKEEEETETKEAL